MKRIYRYVAIFCGLALLAGCNLPIGPAASTTVPTPPNTLAAPTTAPASTQAAATAPASPTAIPTVPAAPAEPTQAAPASQNVLSNYLDDRSTAVGVIQSLFNAVNLKEYSRAYSYWRNPPESYPQFKQGYQNTASVTVTTGPVGTDVGAGQIYYSVAVLLHAQTTGGQAQDFYGCYNLHLARPEIQAAPPFQPLAIESADVQQAGSGADLNNLLAHACDSSGRAAQPLNPIPTTDPVTVAPDNYLDDRSDGIEVIRSLFNAINRKEYLRAYSYWQTPPMSFEDFQKGYQNTASVDVIFGTQNSGVGAGQIYYSVPTGLVAHTTGGETQTYAGCYQLHLANPLVQDKPPFQPLGVIAGNLKQVANDANLSELLKSACPTQ